jgi:hypothetical protein
MSYSLLRTEDATLPTLTNESAFVKRGAVLPRKLCVGTLVLFAVLCVSALRVQLQDGIGGTGGTVAVLAFRSMEKAGKEWITPVENLLGLSDKSVSKTGDAAVHEAMRSPEVKALETKATEFEVGTSIQFKKVAGTAEQRPTPQPKLSKEELRHENELGTAKDLLFGFLVGPCAALLIAGFAECCCRFCDLFHR